jgi:hypothetical protein
VSSLHPESTKAVMDFRPGFPCIRTVLHCFWVLKGNRKLQVPGLCPRPQN